MPVSRSTARDTRSCLPNRAQSRRPGQEERGGWLGADDPLGATAFPGLLGLAEHRSSQDSREPLAASVGAVLEADQRGCQLDRKMDDLIRAAGFQISSIKTCHMAEALDIDSRDGLSQH
jgi:hypothetical protein